MSLYFCLEVLHLNGKFASTKKGDLLSLLIWLSLVVFEQFWERFFEEVVHFLIVVLNIHFF
jgi:hypothetical protein